jgi:hypothetical protein
MHNWVCRDASRSEGIRPSCKVGIAKREPRHDTNSIQMAHKSNERDRRKHMHPRHTQRIETLNEKEVATNKERERRPTLIYIYMIESGLFDTDKERT